MATTKTTTQNEKPATNGLLKFMVFLLTFLTLVVGYLAYQVFHSEAKVEGKGEEKKSALTSFLHKEEKEELLQLDEFTIKLADGHYAKLSMNVGFTGKAEELTEIKPVIRDKVIFELMKLKTANLSVQEIEKTKALMVEKMNPLLKEAQVKSIYIDNIVVQ